jgi:hypothetical protein
MRRLRPEPPDEETVARIMEIFRRYWRKQDSEAAGELEGGVSSPAGCQSSPAGRGPENQG